MSLRFSLGKRTLPWVLLRKNCFPYILDGFRAISLRCREENLRYLGWLLLFVLFLLNIIVMINVIVIAVVVAAVVVTIVIIIISLIVVAAVVVVVDNPCCCCGCDMVLVNVLVTALAVLYSSMIRYNLIYHIV